MGMGIGRCRDDAHAAMEWIMGSHRYILKSEFSCSRRKEKKFQWFLVAKSDNLG